MWQLNDEVETLLRAAAHEHYRRAGSGRACRPPATYQDERAGWQALAEQGWLGLVLPEAWGGSGLGLGSAAVLTRVMGEHVAREPYIACGLMPALMLSALDSPIASGIGQDIAGGATRYVVAWQEPHRGLDLIPTRVTAVEKGNELLVTGQKTMVAGWQPGATVLVTASCDGASLLLRVSADEVTTSEVRTMADGSVCADIALAQVVVTNDDVLARGPVAERSMRAAVYGSLLALCAYLEGLAAGALALTVDYIRQRRQFDQPISDFQAIRHRIADVAMGVELARASWRRALMELAPTHRRDEMPWTLSAAKVRTSEVALLAAREGVQFHGAFGYTEEADIGQYLQTALRAASWLGNVAEHRGHVAHTKPPALSIHG